MIFCSIDTLYYYKAQGRHTPRLEARVDIRVVTNNYGTPCCKMPKNVQFSKSKHFIDEFQIFLNQTNFGLPKFGF